MSLRLGSCSIFCGIHSFELFEYALQHLAQIRIIIVIVMKLIIETERLCLQPLAPRDSDKVLAYNERNMEFFRPWLPAYGPDFFSERFHQLWLKRDAEELKAGRQLKLFIFEREDTKLTRVIGDISFSNIVLGVLRSCFVGYKIDRQENSKGYMTEALAHAIQYMFEVRQLHRIEANIMPRNLASQRVVEKLGFEQEGLSKSYLKINSVWEDHLRYALINERMDNNATMR